MDVCNVLCQVSLQGQQTLCWACLGMLGIFGDRKTHTIGVAHGTTAVANSVNTVRNAYAAPCSGIAVTVTMLAGKDRCKAVESCLHAPVSLYM